ncbi:putative membrane protein, partial [Emiliania huxleyi virus 145]
ERKLYRINHLKSMFDATNDVLRHSQIQSRGLDRPVVRNIAFAASKLTDWLRTVPESKYPSEGISREIYNEFDLAEKRRMQTEIQREESIALELERNNKIADEWIRQHPDEMQKLRERQKRDEIAKK